jgi:hypothetical protein
MCEQYNQLGADRVLGSFEVLTDDSAFANVPGARLRGLVIALALKRTGSRTALNTEVGFRAMCLIPYEPLDRCRRERLCPRMPSVALTLQSPKTTIGAAADTAPPRPCRGAHADAGRSRPLTVPLVVNLSG